MKQRTSNIDDYLGTLSSNDRETLEKLRSLIRTSVPKVEECISYGVPAFRVNGKLIAGIAASKKGFSFYPMSGSVIETLKTELMPYNKTKGSIQFTDSKPLSVQLVKKLLQVRIAEIEG